MTLDDAHVALGVPLDASLTEVKAAWRRLAAQWHPDRNVSADAASWMQRINGAYEQICLASAVLPTAPNAPNATPTDATTGSGRVVQRRVRLSLEDAALGCVRELRGRLSAACLACAGTGQSPQPQTCKACRGAGRARTSWWVGWPAAAHAQCADCDGQGTVRLACPACEAAGQTLARYRTTVRLPAGVRDGDVLNADGGGTHRGGFDGRLELRVALRPHGFFVTDTQDPGALRCELPVDGFAWLAEAWIDVPSLSGMQQMRLRRNRRVYRLRGQGLPLLRGSAARGDYLVTVLPTFAEHPNAEQQALLQQLAAMAGANPAPALRAWQSELRRWQRGRVPRPSDAGASA